jgi:hypothetical protein
LKHGKTDMRVILGFIDDRIAKSDWIFWCKMTLEKWGEQTCTLGWKCCVLVHLASRVAVLAPAWFGFARFRHGAGGTHWFWRNGEQKFAGFHLLQTLFRLLERQFVSYCFGFGCLKSRRFCLWMTKWLVGFKWSFRNYFFSWRPNLNPEVRIRTNSNPN